jgi:hypothetical protein
MSDTIMEELEAIESELDNLKHQHTGLRILQDKLKSKMAKVYPENLDNPKEVGIMLEESYSLSPLERILSKRYVNAGKIQPNGLREFIKVGGKEYNRLLENEVEIDGVPLTKFHQFTGREVESLKQLNNRVFRKNNSSFNV